VTSAADTSNSPIPVRRSELLTVGSRSPSWGAPQPKGTFDPQLDNGPYGAGHIVVHGYFAISLRQALGSTPSEVQHIFLRAVPPELAGQR